MTTAGEWSGPVGDVWAAHWIETDLSFAGLSERLDPAIAAAAPGGGGRAVDLGCGAGVTSIALAKARPDLAVIGVDVSTDLVRIASVRGEGIANLRFAVADLNTDAATAARGADLLCSRHGVMFFDDPAHVFAGLRGGVDAGARLVFSCFRSPSLNPWASTLVAELAGAPLPSPAGYAPSPFSFADPGFVAPTLASAGWHADAPEPVDYSYIVSRGSDAVAAAVAFFRWIGPVARLFQDTPVADRPVMLDKLSALLQTRMEDDTVAFPAAAWIWRATAGEKA